MNNEISELRPCLTLCSNHVKIIFKIATLESDYTRIFVSENNKVRKKLELQKNHSKISTIIDF